jgi:hypothetical protein
MNFSLRNKAEDLDLNIALTDRELASVGPLRVRQLIRLFG